MPKARANMSNWYEEFGFENSPLLKSPLISDFNYPLIGMEKELAEVIYRLKSSSMMFVCGNPGSGKTHLIKEAMKKFRGKIIYVNCSTIKKQLDIEELLINKYGFIKGKILRKKPREMILILDNVTNLSKLNCEKIKYFFDQNYLKSIIFTGIDIDQTSFTSSLKQRIGKRIVKLSRMKDSGAIEMVNSRLITLSGEKILSENLIKKFFEVSDKNPQELLKNIELFLSASKDLAKDLKKDYEVESLQRILNKAKKEFGTEIEENETINNSELCMTCGSKLTLVGDDWRCENCDTCCSNCGAFVDDDTEKICPYCYAEFE